MKKQGISKWHKILKETRSEAKQQARILLSGHDEAIADFKAFLGPGTEPVIKLSQGRGRESVEQDIDLAIIALSGSAAIEGAITKVAETARRSGLDVIALIDETGLSEAARYAKQAEAELVFDLSPGRVKFFSTGMSRQGQVELLDGLARRLEGKEISLAASIPVFRSGVVNRIIEEAANQNALIGVASFVPGSDLPVLTANQIKMVLKIASAHGVELSLKRAREILFVVGGGFTLRAVARQIVGVVPVAGWAVKGAIAYSGTRAVGNVAKRYFDRMI